MRSFEVLALVVMTSLIREIAGEFTVSREHEDKIVFTNMRTFCYSSFCVKRNASCHGFMCCTCRCHVGTTFHSQQHGCLTALEIRKLDDRKCDNPPVIPLISPVGFMLDKLTKLKGCKVLQMMAFDIVDGSKKTCFQHLQFTQILKSEWIKGRLISIETICSLKSGECFDFQIEGTYTQGKSLPPALAVSCNATDPPVTIQNLPDLFTTPTSSVKTVTTTDKTVLTSAETLNTTDKTTISPTGNTVGTSAEIVRTTDQTLKTTYQTVKTFLKTVNKSDGTVNKSVKSLNTPDENFITSGKSLDLPIKSLSTAERTNTSDEKLINNTTLDEILNTTVKTLNAFVTSIKTLNIFYKTLNESGKNLNYVEKTLIVNDKTLNTTKKPFDESKKAIYQINTTDYSKLNKSHNNKINTTEKTLDLFYKAFNNSTKTLDKSDKILNTNSKPEISSNVTLERTPPTIKLSNDGDLEVPKEIVYATSFGLSFLLILLVVAMVIAWVSRRNRKKKEFVKSVKEKLQMSQLNDSKCGVQK